MDNLQKNKILSVVVYFGFETFFTDSDDEESKANVKISNFSEEIVPSMNSKQFKIHFRLDVHVFESLLQKIHSLHKTHTVGHPELSLDKSCMIMIWYLANLESFRSVANRFGISKSTCWAVLYKICRLLLDVNMQYNIIAWPSNNRAESIMAQFQRRYGMPGVVGAIDGTHIRINAPKENHNSYINRKNYHSVLLQGVCDHNLLFLDVYTGLPGSIHDAALFKKSDIYNRITTGNIQFSDNAHLIGDKAYALTRYLMVPFREHVALSRSEKNFNLVLSKTRVVIENAFALLKGRFRRLKYLETVRHDFIVLIIVAGTILHNLCIACGDNFEELNMNDEIQEERNAINSDNAIQGLQHEDNAGIRKRRAIMNNLPVLI